MENKPIRFDGRVPKTLKAMAERYANRVCEITGKGILYDDCYDVSYRAGWKSDSDPLGVLHSDNGSTAAELAARIRNAMPCDCEECERNLKGVYCA